MFPLFLSGLHSVQMPGQITERPEAALIWINFGPYHYARISALARKCRIAAIQLASRQQLCGWDGETSQSKAPVFTVTDGLWEKLNQAKVAIRLWLLLNHLRPEALLIPAYDTIPAVAAAVWGRLHASRTIVMAVSTQQDYRRQRYKEAVKSVLLKVLFERAVTTGTEATHYLETLGFPRRRISVCGNVVDNTFFWEGTEYWRRSSTPSACRLPRRYFLYVGRLAPEKNVHGLIGSFDRYRRQGGTLELVLVGDGPLRTELERFANNCSSKSHICFAGRQNVRSLLSYYAFADCSILPSHREPWGLVVNEAMAAGLPVIVSNRCGCAADLVRDGENGFVFDPRKEDELIERLHWIDSMSGKDLRRMGARSREIIAGYSLESWAAKVQLAIGN